MDAPLVNGSYLLEKFPGKGGWTYAALPEVQPDPHAHFGWVRVKGEVDGFPLAQYHLMPMGDGRLFLPVKAEIRKKIKKEAGDWVTVVLFLDESPLAVPQELMDCLTAEPEAQDRFNKLLPTERKRHLDHIYSAKTDETKVRRIAAMIDSLFN